MFKPLGNEVMLCLSQETSSQGAQWILKRAQEAGAIPGLCLPASGSLLEISLWVLSWNLSERISVHPVYM